MTKTNLPYRLMANVSTEIKACPDCKVMPGRHHRAWCDVARCYECGGQALSCDCPPTTRVSVWHGGWHGKLECREYGLWCKWDNENCTWVRCQKDDSEATEDLNTLYELGTWNKEKQRIVIEDYKLKELRGET